MKENKKVFLKALDQGSIGIRPIFLLSLEVKILTQI